MLYHGDCLDILKTLPDDSVDAIVTDPPYGLAFMGKHWDYDVPSVDIWRECLRVLKPGGHLLSFAGTRTYHRMTVNIEDAGFEIRDMVAWIYAQGFPKSHDVSKAIDKAAGAEREVVGTKLGLPGYSLTNGSPGGVAMKGNIDGSLRNGSAECAITAPATSAAQEWQGWGTALKPALEPVCVARKPLIGTVAENVLAHGTGALNIDGCRVEADWNNDPSKRGFGYGVMKQGERQKYIDRANGEWGMKDETQWTPTQGRWPANLIHDGSDEVVALFPVTNGKYGMTKHGSGTNTKYGKFKRSEQSFLNDGVPDSGSAARFFYVAKASKADRDSGGIKNIHATVKPTDLMRYLCRLVTPPGGVVLDPFMGSGSTGKAAALEGFQFIGIEREAEYIEIARRRIEAATPPLFRVE